ncbi:hypothetical protein PTSG_00851 [Salpingoeca rosetta]|uniref:Protein kintoun n=1 Tax=Salpingoeca rosetta (strain ATCC 50818 / BSB-021) TaxID=946362 RepID=F2TXN5_SALR5|nr:uncharacterized protein PTSG_00851 [Salpingoeca rosetta]EGD76144.1 hypothetical protein PTSG_00851 [Salpingoeca rosetta]|eukprot:XP_004998319.1 hypothetical protein PTSG_00851 [Salpingoeca rosetta]
MATTSDDKEFVPTAEELEAIGNAMKDENFRKLLAEYAEEISNPENRKRYEEELRQMEAMQGNDVKFINPEPGFVVKSKLKDSDTKVFMNICQSEVIDKPTSTTATEGSKRGVRWSLPHSITKHREDLDKAGNTCIVYDVVFHPQALRLANMDARFKEMVVGTAFDGIEQRFSYHKLDRSTKKHLKMKFKGMPSRSVIRTSASGSNAAAGEDVVGAVKSQIQKQHQQAKQHQQNQPKQKPAVETDKHTDDSSTKQPDDRTPAHRVVYRRAFDMSDVRDAPDAGTSTRPEAIVVSVELPKCKSAASVDLDVEERLLALSSPDGPYDLSLPLSFPVDEENGTAKFDKSKRILTVTLPVLPATRGGEDDDAQVAPHPMLGRVAETQSRALEGKKGTIDDKQGQPQQLGTVTEVSRDDSSIGKAADAAAPDSTSSALSATQDTANVDGACEDDSSNNKSSIDNSMSGDTNDSAANNADNTVNKHVPHVTFVQTPTKLSLIIDEAGLNSSNVSACKHVTTVATGIDIHGLDVTLRDSQPPLLFRFDSCFEEDQPACDVSPENVVIKLTKTPAISWQRVRYGHDEKTLRERLLFTEENTKQDIKAMADPWTEPSAERAVTSASTSGCDTGGDEEDSSMATTNSGVVPIDERDNTKEIDLDMKQADSPGAHETPSATVVETPRTPAVAGVSDVADVSSASPASLDPSTAPPEQQPQDQPASTARTPLAFQHDLLFDMD